jgi:hypothetical protein
VRIIPKFGIGTTVYYQDKPYTVLSIQSDANTLYYNIGITLAKEIDLLEPDQYTRLTALATKEKLQAKLDSL